MSEHLKIMKIKKDEDGDIVEVMLENGSTLAINHAILMAKNGSLDGTIVVRGQNGGEFLRTDPNNYHIEDLADFPTHKN